MRGFRNRQISIAGLLLIGLGFRVEASPPEESSVPVNRYRIDSQYGSRDPVLSPLYPKDGKWELAGSALAAPFSSLTDAYGATGVITYHFDRRHSLELPHFSYVNPSLSGFTQTQISEKISPSQRAGSTLEVPLWAASVGYVYTPYYIKMSLTERTVWHFDFYTGFGLHLMQTGALNLDNVLGQKQTRFGPSFVGGFRFYIPNRYSLKIELRDSVYRGSDLGKVGNRNFLQISAGLGFFFGDFPEL